MNTRKFVNVVLVAACSIALASCDTGATPESQSSSTSTNTPSVSSEETSPTPDSGSAKYEPATPSSPAKNVPVPSMPSGAKDSSAEGAKEFALHYFDLINYTIETNDAGPIMELTTHQCELCGVGIIDPANDAQKIGKWQVGGQHDFTIIDVYSQKKNEAVVTVSYTVKESKFYISPNKLDNTLKSLPPTLLAITLVYKEGWKVDTMLGVS